MRTSTTVPIKRDERYKNALRALANQNGVEMGEIVSRAIDIVYGDALKPYIAFFAAQDVQSFRQLDNERASGNKDNPKNGKKRRVKEVANE